MTPAQKTNAALRARHEHQIKLTERLGYYNGAFEKALFAVIFQRGTRDLAWFTDEQIAEIRDEMISNEWRHHKRLRGCRKQAVALTLSKESTHE